MWYDSPDPQAPKRLDAEFCAIKRSYGRDRLHIEFTGSKGFLEPLLERQLYAPTRQFRRKSEADASPKDTLQAPVQEDVLITRLELLKPSLNEIFIDRTAHA